jgi:glycogen(starch) synthase
MPPGRAGSPGCVDMRPLSVALFSWEYPPVVVGGLSRHVFDLSRHLALQGHDVTVYTRGHPGAPAEEVRGGVRVSRVDGYPPPLAIEDLVPWTLAFNIGLIHRAMGELSARPPDVLHAHDWLVAYAATVLKDLCSLPLVATIHATEHGRHGGRLPGPTQRFVHHVERWLVSVSDRDITCSAFMRDEVITALGADEELLDLIPNQVDLTPFSPPAPSLRPGLWPENRPLILFAGRLEYEKGVQTLLDAFPVIERRVPGVGLLVAGEGTYRPALEARAERLGLDGQVRFEGFVEESRLRSLYRTADLAIVPSLYEPFGLVTLEAMASGTPVVVADAGGLCETVEHGVSGLRFAPGDAGGLARAVTRVLRDPSLAASLAREARSALEARASWSGAAARTAEAYGRAIEHADGSATLRAVRNV